jgi:hypothetical protein
MCCGVALGVVSHWGVLIVQMDRNGMSSERVVGWRPPQSRACSLENVARCLSTLPMRGQRNPSISETWQRIKVQDTDTPTQLQRSAHAWTYLEQRAKGRMYITLKEIAAEMCEEV